MFFGDVIYIVKSYFGLGVNSVWEDVKVFVEVFDDVNGDIFVVLLYYFKKCVVDVKVFVDFFCSFDGGFMIFVFFFIVDFIFNKVAFWFFMFNMI